MNLPLLKRLLGAKEFRARAAAVRVLQHWFDRVDGALALLAPMVRDEAPRVRLEAVRALSFVPTAAAAEAALGVLAKPMDYYLQYVLDSTMTTLEPVWKPRLTSGAPFAEDNPAGLAFVLERLEPGELASVKRSDPVYEAMVSRPGIDPALRRDALSVLATRTGTSMGTALLAAVSHVAATPGAGAATADLMRLLADMPTADLAAQRPALENLARTGALDTVRQGALLALLRLDGSADAVWRLTGTSARLRMDLLRAAAAAPEGPAIDSLRAAVLPWFRDATATGAPLAPPQPPVTGRYVRLVRPGRATVLSVTEVQVFSGGENVAMKGTATQSSTLAGGATGGHARARHRRRPRARPAGRHRSAQGHGPVHERRTGSLVGARSRRRAADRHHRPVGRVRRHAERDLREHPRRQPQAGLRPGRPAAPGADVPHRRRRRPGDPAADRGDRDAARHARA